MGTDLDARTPIWGHGPGRHDVLKMLKADLAKVSRGFLPLKLRIDKERGGDFLKRHRYAKARIVVWKSTAEKISFPERL